MPRKKYARPFYEVNKHFQTWLPETLYNWLLDYLQKYSYGNSTAEMFRIMLYEIEKLEQEGVTFFNVREARTKERDMLFKTKYGNVTDEDKICLRNISRENLDSTQRALSCGFCKDSQKAIYKACQELRQEYESQKNR